MMAGRRLPRRQAVSERRTRIMARPVHEVHGQGGLGRGDSRRDLRGAGRPEWTMTGTLIVVAVVAGLAVLALFGLPRLFAGGPPTEPPAPSSGTSAATAEPAAPSASSSPRTAPASAVPGRSPSRRPRTPPPSHAAPATPAATASATGHPGAAPATAAEFELDGQVIEIAFPLKTNARYRYRDNFLDPREGEAHGYNHARQRRGDRLLRAHDGTDIYAAHGTAVVAPFDGLVIEPSRRWEPWIPERYGKTAVIESTEPTSDGYTAILSHLSALFVEPGQVVHRGEVVGLVGATGNAEGGRPHLHFELRAPFPLSWEQVGEDRLIDAFNPYPSLVAADPRAGN